MFADSGGMNFFDLLTVLERCLTTAIIDHFFRLLAAAATDYANFVSMVCQVRLLRMLMLARGYHIVFS